MFFIIHYRILPFKKCPTVINFHKILKYLSRIYLVRMVKCAVKKCQSQSNITKKQSGVTFHRLPRDPIRREKWTRILRVLRKESDWSPSATSTVCSKHFKEEDKSVTEKGLVVLNKNAVPVATGKIKIINDEREKKRQTPRELKMEKIIRKIRVISNNRLKNYKSLQRRYSRMKIKMLKLIDIIKHLKDKINITEAAYLSNES